MSTNKLGAVEAIKALAPKIEGFEKLFVKVNRDGSRAFSGTLEGTDVVEVGQLRPGFQAYIRQPGQTMATAVTHPPAGFGPPTMNLIALFTKNPGETKLDGRWFEAIAPAAIQPQNLYEAQRTKRLSVRD